MLKGHVFSKQLFGNPIFALFINTFLNGANGVSNNFKNGMAVTYNGSNVSIDSGAVCIQGRFLEEDSLTTLSAGTNSAYCKLVIEIDLDKQNTESEFNQASYKIITSTSAYPNLTQTNIVKNNSGVYQYELARFRTGTNGIIEFQDMRTFLDFDSIYNAIETEYETLLNQLKSELESVEDGSAFLLKNNIVMLRGFIDVTGQIGGNSLSGDKIIQFPEGFNSENSVVLAISFNIKDHANFVGGYGTLADYANVMALTSGGIGKQVIIRKQSNDMLLKAWFQTEGNLAESMTNYSYEYKIILMKYQIASTEYTLGDVNGDGEITQDDLTMISNYLAKTTALTEKQFMAADVTKDGKVDSADINKLNQYLLGNIPSLD